MLKLFVTEPDRMVVSRALRLMTFAVSLLATGTALATTPAVVVDLETGRVLHAERATDPWFPASITKLMTVYVALDMVRSGEATMDRLLTVSENAYALPPSKMAFKPGSQIRLDNALKIIMVKSANDVATTIAEGLGGSVEGFADRMNATALRVGMKESRFTNPHGLPDERQQTSARDMALLARALIREFPERADLFQIGAIQFGRRVMRNHNGLIGRYPGADGMKTGFICASGFNVVATAQRNGRRLVTVVLGSTSANERTLKAAELFDYGFENVSSLASAFRPTVDALPASSVVTPPNMRPVICERRGPMPGEDDGSASAATGDTGMPVFGALAFAGAYVPPTNRTVLGPRGAVTPVQVWLGPKPPNEAELAAQAAEEDAAEEARKGRKGGKKAPAKVAAPKPAPPAKELKAPEPIMAEEPGAKKQSGRVSVSLTPVTGAAERAKEERAARAVPAIEKPAPKPVAVKVAPPAAKPAPAKAVPAKAAAAPAPAKPAATPAAAKAVPAKAAAAPVKAVPAKAAAAPEKAVPVKAVGTTANSAKPLSLAPPAPKPKAAATNGAKPKS
jgi:D-alanyl-D-alanine carboxypeptidase